MSSHGRIGSGWAVTVALFAGLGAGEARGGLLDDPPASARLDLSSAEGPTHAEFASQGSRWWTVLAGVSHDFSDSHDFNLAARYSFFVVDDLEFGVELGGWYFDQKGDNAFGLNASMIWRYHFVHREHFTFYGDIGMGLLVATDEVPDGGTSFDFTPRIGLGTTWELGSGLWLDVGARWAHISNARIQGDADNPGRDSVMGYIGLTFPF